MAPSIGVWKHSSSTVGNSRSPLNAVRHSLPHAAQTDETDLHFSIPLKWDMGIALMFPTLRRSPAVYRFRVLDLALADYPSYPYPAVQQEKSAAMWNTVRSLFTRASGDFLRAWRSMAYTDVAYKLIAFAMLTPATSWLL